MTFPPPAGCFAISLVFVVLMCCSPPTVQYDIPIQLGSFLLTIAVILNIPLNTHPLRITFDWMLFGPQSRIPEDLRYYSEIFLMVFSALVIAIFVPSITVVSLRPPSPPIRSFLPSERLLLRPLSPPHTTTTHHTSHAHDTHHYRCSVCLGPPQHLSVATSCPACSISELPRTLGIITRLALFLPDPSLSRLSLTPSVLSHSSGMGGVGAARDGHGLGHHQHGDHHHGPGQGRLDTTAKEQEGHRRSMAAAAAR